MSHPDYTYRAKLVRVIDGDTVILCIDMGLRITTTAPVRLLGINCPEMRDQAGKDARAWTVTWFDSHPEFLVTTARDPEKYGRWLGVLVGPDGLSLNDALVAAGHAEIYLP